MASQEQIPGPNPKAIELANASFVLFADDGTIDADELQFLLQVALRDGTIDHGEKDVLRGLFNRIREEDVSASVWESIQQVRQQHGI